MSQTVTAHSPGSASDQATAIATLPADLAIMRMENENIMSLAAARPRDIEGIKQELAAQLHAFPQHATTLIYSKPVGRGDDFCGACGATPIFRKNGRKAHQCFSCKSGDIRDGEMKHATNLSIRAAEMLAEAYGFNRVRQSVTDIDGNSAKVEATFTDYQKGRIWTDESIVSKYFTTRNGETRKIADDRFWNVVVRAEGSKRIREVITRSVSAGLKAWLYDEAEKIAADVLDDATIDRTIGEFANKGVTLEILEWHLSKRKSLGWTKHDRLRLIGLWNALKDGETSLQELQAAMVEAGDSESPPAGKPFANGGNGGAVSAADLQKPKKSTTNGKAAKPAAGPPATEAPNESKVFVELRAELKATEDEMGVRFLLDSVIPDAFTDGKISTAEKAQLTELGEEIIAAAIQSGASDQE